MEYDRWSAFTHPVPDKGAAYLCEKNERGRGGFFPVGSNDYWHGGAHLAFDAEQPLVAVHDGRLVAYRIAEQPSKFEVDAYREAHPTAPDTYSKSFMLIKHRHVTPNGNIIVFYALYMHLLSRDEMASRGLPLPPVLQKRWKVIGGAVGGGVDLLEDPADPNRWTGKVPPGAYLGKVANAPPHPTHEKVSHRGKQRFVGVALIPKGFKLRKHKGAPIAVYDAHDKAKIVGYLRPPKYPEELVRCDVSPPPKKPPPAPPPKAGSPPPPPPPPAPWYETEPYDEKLYEGYRKVDFEVTMFRVEGFVERARCIALGPSSFVLAGAGINVLSRVPAAAPGTFDYVPRGFLPKGSLVSFKDPKAVKNGEHHELSEGGYLLVDAASLAEHEDNITPVFGPVVATSAPVRQGEVIGYAGPYLFEPRVVHFEIVSSERAFMANPTKDAWGAPVTVVIDKDAVFKERKITPRGKAAAVNPPIAVSWPSGSILRLLADEESAIRPRYYKVQRAGVEGWIESKYLQLKAAAGAASAPADPASEEDDADDDEEREVPPGPPGAQYTVTKDMTGLFFREPSLDPSATAAPDIPVTISKKDVLVAVEEGKSYVRVHLTGVEVTESGRGWIDADAVKQEGKKAVLAAGVAALHSKATGDAADVTAGLPLPAGTVVRVLQAGKKGKTRSQISYTYKTQKDFTGWALASTVEELPPPAPPPGEAQPASAPAARRCALTEDLKGLFSPSPPRSGSQKPEIVQHLPRGTKGTIEAGSKRFTRVVHKLEGEKTGWVSIDPHTNGKRFFTRESFGGTLLDEGAYHPLGATTRKVGKKSVEVLEKIESLYTHNPNATEVTFPTDLGKNTKVITKTISRWGIETFRRRWIEVEYERGKRGWIDLEATEGPNVGKIKILSPYDWPGWTPFEEHGPFSTNGLCDVPELLQMIGDALEHPDHALTPEEVKQAFADGTLTIAKIGEAVRRPAIADQLRRTSCLHPTEWDGDTDDELAKYADLEEGPYNLTKATHAQTKSHIKALQFWADVSGQGVDFPEPKVVWHHHPIGFIENLRGFIGITAEELRQIVPYVRGHHHSMANYDALIERFVPLLNEAMFKYEINTKLRQAHFLAQLAHESASLSAMREDGADATFNGRVGIQGYAFRSDLSNYAVGDGARFKGRGLVQLTGRENYKLYGAYLGEDIAGIPGDPASPGDPSKLERDEYSVDSAGWYWTVFKGLNAAADADDFEGVTRRINGAMLNLDERADFLKRAIEVLRG